MNLIDEPEIEPEGMMIVMKYEMIFLDVDGTLKQEPYNISENNKKAVRVACKAGVKVSIASGRNKDLLLTTVKELGLYEYGNSYTVALNGAHIIDNNTGKTLQTIPIPLHLVKQLFHNANKHEITCHVYTENYVVFNYHDDQYQWYQKGGCQCELIDLEREDFGLKEAPLKFFLLSKDKSKLRQFKEEMSDSTKEVLNAEFSSIYSLEYTSIHASKGLGMEYVCNLFQVPLSKTIAVGDGENDISMLSKAGLGIAMKNGLESVKAVADTISDYSCKEDGVKEIIHKYFLL